MDKLATYYRCAQLFAHNAHNLTSGPNFFADHEFLGELYGTYESAYDSIIERALGMGEQVDLVKIQQDAAQCLSDYSTDKIFVSLLNLELLLCTLLEEANGKASLGTQNLLQGLCDASEARQYQIQQRLRG